MLKSFITVFIIIEGLENKLTRAPLLGLAKSIYYFINEMSKNYLINIHNGCIILCERVETNRCISVHVLLVV